MGTPKCIAFLLNLLLFGLQTQALASPSNEPKKKITLNQFFVINNYEFHDKGSFDRAIQSRIWHPSKTDPDIYWCGDEDLDAAKMNATVFHWAYVANGTATTSLNGNLFKRDNGNNEKALRMMGALGRDGFGELVLSDNPNWWIPTMPKVGAVNMMSNVYMPQGVVTKQIQPNVFHEIIEGHGFHVSRGRLPGMIQRPVPDAPRAPMRPVRRPPLQLDRMTAEQFLSDWPRLPDDDSDIFETETMEVGTPDGEKPKSPEGEVKKPTKDDPGEGPAPKDPEKQPNDPNKGGKEPLKETAVEKPAPKPEDIPNDPNDKGKGRKMTNFGDPSEPPKGTSKDNPVSNDPAKPNDSPNTGSKDPQPPSKNANQPPQEPAKPPAVDKAPQVPENLNNPIDQNPAHNVQNSQVQTNNIDNSVHNINNNNYNNYNNYGNGNQYQGHDPNRIFDQNPAHQQQNSGDRGNGKKHDQGKTRVDAETQTTEVQDPGKSSSQDQGKSNTQDQVKSNTQNQGKSNAQDHVKPNTQDQVKSKPQNSKPPIEKDANGQPAKSSADSVNSPEPDSGGEWDYPENNVGPEKNNGRPATNEQAVTKGQPGTEAQQVKNGQPNTKGQPEINGQTDASGQQVKNGQPVDVTNPVDASKPPVHEGPRPVNNLSAEELLREIEAEKILAEGRRQRFDEAKKSLQNRIDIEAWHNSASRRPKDIFTPPKAGQSAVESAKNLVSPQIVEDMKLEIEAQNFLQEERIERFENALTKFEDLGKPPTTQGGGNPVKQLDVLGPKEIIPSPGDVSSGLRLAPHEEIEGWGSTVVTKTFTEEKARIKEQNEAFQNARKALEERLENSVAKNPDIGQQNKGDVVKENPVQAKPQDDGQPGSSSSGGQPQGATGNGQPGSYSGGPSSDNGLSGPGSKGQDNSRVPRPDSLMEELPGQGQKSNSLSSFSDTSSDYSPGSSEGLSPNPPSSPVQGPDKVNAEHISGIKDQMSELTNTWEASELANVPGSRPNGVSGPSGSSSSSNQANILRDFDFGDKELNEAWRGTDKYKFSKLPPMERPPGMKPI
jgi:hypothetical protein